MIRIYPERLTSQLEKGLSRCYLLIGDEPLQLLQSQDAICHAARQKGFLEKNTFTLDNHTDWQEIVECCQSYGLFSNQQILCLQFPDAGISAPLAKQLEVVLNQLHSDILLILLCHKLTKAQENSRWYKLLPEDSVIVSCLVPDQHHLTRWINNQAKQLKLSLDQECLQLLSYYYEGNLLALSQALEKLSLLYPDGKLTLPRLQSVSVDMAQFTPYHWLDAILAGKIKRSWHILQQLQLVGCEPLILLRTLQKELLLLLKIKQHTDTPLKILFDQHKVWQNRRPLLTQALQRLSRNQLRQALSMLVSIEIALKQDYSQTVWPELENLSLLMCGKNVIDVTH